MKRACIFLAAVAGLGGGCRNPDHAHRHGMEPGSIDDRIARYEEPDREAWQKPDEIVRALALAPDARVADLGAGSGYMSVRLARAVPRGQVVALDVETALVAHIARRARDEGLANLLAVEVPPDDPCLRPASVDLVLILDVYHHLEDRPDYLEKLARALRPGGRIAIVDFRKESKRGPKAEHKVEKDVVIAEAAEADLAPVREHGFLPDQYFIELAPRP